MKLKFKRIGASRYSTKIEGKEAEVEKVYREGGSCWYVSYSEYSDPEYWSDSYDTLAAGKASLNRFAEEKTKKKEV